jgi:hypothetical protein
MCGIVAVRRQNQRRVRYVNVNLDTEWRRCWCMRICEDLHADNKSRK